MSALTSSSAHRQAEDLPDFVGETVDPILIGSALGGLCGILIWILVSARFGVTGWLW